MNPIISVKPKICPVCVLGVAALLLTACGKTQGENDNPADLNTAISGLEGVWATVHVPQDLRVFENGEETLYNALYDAAKDEVTGYSLVGTRQISSVEKTSDTTGEYYKICMSDSDVIYYWYPNRADELEYHWGTDGYSASDSLMRQSDASIDDYTIIEGSLSDGGINTQFIDFVSDPYKYEWDGINYDRYLYDGLDYGWNAYALIDFDGDGTDELIITNTDGENRVDGGMQAYLIACLSDGKLAISELGDGVASAGGYRGTLYYIQGSGLIYDDSFSAPYGAPAFSVYRLKNGLFEYSEGGYLYPNNEYDYPECIENGEWHLNNDIVTEKEYEKAFKEITANESGIALGDIDYVGKDDILKELSSR